MRSIIAKLLPLAFFEAVGVDGPLYFGDVN